MKPDNKPRKDESIFDRRYVIRGGWVLNRHTGETVGLNHSASGDNIRALCDEIAQLETKYQALKALRKRTK